MNKKRLDLFIVFGILLVLSFGFISADCSGTPASCNTFNAQSSCAAQSGCSWKAAETESLTASVIAGSCSGTATACSAFTSNTSCVSQVGCQWETKGKTYPDVGKTCPYGYICLDSDYPKKTLTFNGISYEVELISASDTTANIKVTTTGGQGVIKEIFENSTKIINGLYVYLKSADKNIFYSSVVLKVGNICEIGYTCLDSHNNPKKTLTFNGISYEVELISASDTTATINVTTTGGQGVMKEISENSAKIINGLYVYLKSADATPDYSRVVLGLSQAIVTTPNCTDTDGGLDYYVKGNVTRGNDTETDYCGYERNSYYNNTLTEFYCTNDGLIGAKTYTDCLNGCVDGACVDFRREETKKILTWCNIIKEPGYYILKNNVTFNHDGICFVIELSGLEDVVTLDCQGYSIKGNNTYNPSGVDQCCGNTPNGIVHIKNCKFENLFQPISVRFGNGSSVINNTITNSYFGIVIGDSFFPASINNPSLIEIRDNNIDTISTEIIIGSDAINVKLTNNRMCKENVSGFYEQKNIICSTGQNIAKGSSSYFYESNCNNLKKLNCSTVKRGGIIVDKIISFVKEFFS